MNVIAIDLAKTVFQVCKTDHSREAIYNKAVNRKRLKEILVQEKESIVAMESCGETHYWARFAQDQNHIVKPIPARVVKAFLQGQKTDANDAVAISVAALQPNISACRLISVEAQSLNCMDGARSSLVSSKVAQANQIRAYLLEFGIPICRSDKVVKVEVPTILGDAENDLTPTFRFTLNLLWQHFISIDNALSELEKEYNKTIKNDEECQRLQKLEGVGPVGALGLKIVLSQPEHFKNGRQAAACVGTTPVQHSSGGKVFLGGISKVSSNKKLRAVLFQGAFAAVCAAEKRKAKSQKDFWIKDLLSRKCRKVVAIGLVNKTIRTAYAILKNKVEYKMIPIM
ncbi:MAG: IS110 family transposase [Psychromonas sp.]|nr:IS110 family transposase [Psychromonas sp.]